MAKFAHDDIVPYGESDLDKKKAGGEMFDSIAFRYDFEPSAKRGHRCALAKKPLAS